MGTRKNSSESGTTVTSSDEPPSTITPSPGSSPEELRLPNDSEMMYMQYGGDRSVDGGVHSGAAEGGHKGSGASERAGGDDREERPEHGGVRTP
ncbi:hypothetical protein H6P81_001532 [Aristolochia fimbriata]|uniref:Uncharacterized protein n=1 Tax=Aristolochia fimbriata TaxID=158543 RepID=A0AAV7F8M9_ARIFI|nr:hypothetical protein H6P81_001532 [Aristolochia fimbriata]